MGTLGADAIPLDGDVMLQCIIDAIAKRPLFGCVFLRIHPAGRRSRQERSRERILFMMLSFCNLTIFYLFTKAKLQQDEKPAQSD